MIFRMKLSLVLLLLITAPAFAWFTYSLEQPIDGLFSNSVTEIFYDGQYIWVATGSGLSGSSDGGQSWFSYTPETGLNANGIAAITQAGPNLLVATADINSTQGRGTGLYYTADRGDNWEPTANPLFTGLGRLSYDLSVFDSVVYSSNFDAGLMRSLDNGVTWEQIYRNAQIESVFVADSSFQRTSGSLYLSALSFSNLIDPYHDDTVIVINGSAEGIQYYYYIGKHKQLATRQVNDIANDGDIWWYATSKGVSRFDDTLLIFNTYDTDNGLPANYAKSIGVKGDVVVAALYDPIQGSNLGIAVSTNDGLSWTLKTPSQAPELDNSIEDFEVQGDWFWAAANIGGLLRSTDDGATWDRFYPFENDTVPSPHFHVHEVDLAQRETYNKISVGTDSGIVSFYFDLDGELDSTVHLDLFDNTSYGQKIISVATFESDTADEYWAVSRPYKTNVNSHPAILRSTDRGFTWIPHLVGPPAIEANDIDIGVEFGDTTIWVASEVGMRQSTDFGKLWNPRFINDIISGDTIYDASPFNEVLIGEFETHMAADGGLAQLYAGLFGQVLRPNFRIHKPSDDPNDFDAVFRYYTPQGEVPGDSALAGNFLVAMCLQRTGDSTNLWAAVRDALENGRNGVSVSGDGGLSWRFTLEDKIVWNLEFNGDTVFAAANQGLFMTTDFGESWQQLSIRDSETGRSISDSTNVFAVRWIEDELWVGTDDGVARSSDLEDWNIVRTFVDIPVGTAETFVSPNPFSPYLGSGDLKFHYMLKNSGNVTITIYDFANNLVKRVVDGVPREANVQYDDIDLWNGLNTKNDPVSAGVYIYLLESTGGDKLWGKIMVIP